MNSLELFQSSFQKDPNVIASAHGRVNLIGEHTDYNNGYVFPTPIPQSIEVSISARKDDEIVGVSEEFGKISSTISSAKDGTWMDFIKGGLHFIKQISPSMRGIDITVSSTVPPGSGLSSSAALETALLRALLKLNNLSIQNEEIARLGQQIEHQFVGTQCGIMDQMASACGEFGNAIFLDCENLQTKSLPLFSDHDFVVIHSGSNRKLSQGKYNERKSETTKAAEILQVPSLRHASLDQLSKIQDPTIQKRAKHIISENDRVMKAFSCLKNNDANQFGELMILSHQSMKTDYEISSQELNQVVSSAINNGALGARLTGAGFGGCVVILSSNQHTKSLIETILVECPQSYWVTTISKNLNP